MPENMESVKLGHLVIFLMYFPLLVNAYISIFQPSQVNFVTWCGPLSPSFTKIIMNFPSVPRPQILVK